ncbi:glycoside hydrolase [Draconibacterium sp. IB214405]|uniref:glycoside hydrolase n=1 Tax=Draconibacterium sp. IB214405 TaxID=3097352 RepID=UPI002A169D1E|nr:glycoside hydrolase [Draconibacterium sp. IB214405]MDX8339594.1 glycoside hydrolase [Draconibacterium sp. IB214405]
MTKRIKLFAKTYGVLLLFLISCSKDPDLTMAALSFVTSSLSSESLSYEGGTVDIDVEWEHTEWKIKSGSTIEGNGIISGISPKSFGSVDSESTVTTVTVTYISNSNLTANRQELILYSTTDNLSDTIILAQEAKPAPKLSIEIDPELTYQVISGFGGANMIWGSDYLTSSEMDKAFGTGEGQLGLSIFRVRLSSSKSEWAGLVNSVKGANDKGVSVLASPWSPPAIWKSNNSVNGGGYLLKEHYADFAAYINEFIQFMADNGAKIDVVSIQNEPDWQASYEGCEYTAEELLDFVKNYADTIQGAKVMAAESLNTNHAYTDDILNDPVAAENLDIVGGHLYGSGLAPYALVHEKGKELWMTEHLLNLDSGNNPDNWTASSDPTVIWEETMEMVTEVQTAMTYNWNAYIWWYIRRYYSFLGDGEKGNTRGEILKRGHAFSQFSKFIRPGYQRIDAQLENASTKATVTAFKSENDIVIVLVNPSDSEPSEMSFTLPGAYSKATAYTTSLSQNSEKEELSLSNSEVNFTLEPGSVKTLVINN